MLCPVLWLSVVFLLSTTFAEPNLFNDGQLGAILGTSFGIPGANATFDYVVVGGGTAGLTVATRLAEDPTVSVAVVEAGGFYEIDNGNLSVVPGLASAFTGSDPKNFQPLVDWGFSTVPQPVRSAEAEEQETIHHVWLILPRRVPTIAAFIMRVAKH